METTNPTFYNKSKIKFFQSDILDNLEQEVNNFMIQTRKIYNVKHQIVSESGYKDMHYIMVSYE